MKIREVCEQVEDVIVEATGGLREEAEARRGEITRSYGLIGRIEAFCREYAELDKLYRRGKSVKVEVLIEGGEFPLADIFVDPCAVYVAAEVLRESGYKKVSRRLWESAMEQLQTIGDFAEGA